MKFTLLPRQFGLCLSVIVAVAFAFVLAKPRSAHGLPAQNVFTTVSAPSYAPELSPGSIAAGFGTGLATRVESASAQPLPTSLAGTTVKVNGQLAPLFFVSPFQINYLIPPDAPLGNLQVIVTSGDGTISTGTVQVNDVSPAIFTVNSQGTGLPSAYLVRVATGGSQTNEPVDARPIDPGPAGDRVFLALYLSGMGRARRETTKVVIAANELDPIFVGPTPGYTGLDQINVELPHYLDGRGPVSLQVRVADRTSNLTEIQMGGQDIRLATTTTLTSSLLTAVAGQPVNFTARVAASAQGAGIPVGDVILLDNGVMIGRLLLDAAGQAVFNYAFATPGSRAITANFEGRTNFKESTGALAAAQVVTKAQSTIAITSTPNPANRDQVIELTAELRPAPPSTLVPTGVVQFKADNVALATPITLIDGKAILSVSTLTVGNHAITADYYGDPSFNQSGPTGFQQVINSPALQVGGIERPSPVYASDEITINGSGFTTNPADHVVEVVEVIGGTDGPITTAQVIAATASQLKVRVPFGAASGKVRVILGGAKSESQDLSLGTSVSGFIQSFKDGTRAAVPDLPVSLMQLTGNRIDATTNKDGSFVLKGATPVFSRIAIGAQAVNGINYPAQTRQITPLNARDTQYSGDGGLANIIEITPIGTTSTGTIAANTPTNESLSVAAPASAEEIANVITSGQVTFDTNNSTITFPGGGTGNLALTLLDPGRTPSNLPAGYFSSTIAQITPFGATLAPGGKLTFPNTDGIPSGTPVRVFRFDQTPNSPTLGQFINVGAATISADGTKIETAANAVTQTSYYFVSRQWQTATIIGVVTEADGQAVRRAVVSARGQAVFTGNNGGFVLSNIPVITPDGTNDQVTIEISFVRADGSVSRTQRTITSVRPGEPIQLTTQIALSRANNNRAPQIIAPASLLIDEGETKDFNFVANDPDGQQVTVAVSGASFASVIAQGNNSYRLRLAPGANASGNYLLAIQASDNPDNGPSLSTVQAVTVSVQKSNSSRPTANYQSVITDEDTRVGITLSANNPRGDPLQFQVVSNASHGVLNLALPNVTYTPFSNYNGVDSFSFKVNSQSGESNVATVFIAIKPVNDPPGLTISSPQSMTVNAGETLKIDISATDDDKGDTLSVSVEGLPPGASFVPTQGGAQFSWTPTFKQIGDYRVSFAVSDDARSRDTALFALNAQPSPLLQFIPVLITVDAKWAKTSGPDGGSIVSLIANGPNIFAGTYGSGVFHSNNEGRSWAPVREGIPDEGLVAYDFTFMGSDLFVVFQRAGIYRTSDNGRIWVPVNNGIRHADGTYPFLSTLYTKGNTLFAGSFGEGVFRSTNSGASWTQLTNGLRGTCATPPAGYSEALEVLGLASKGSALFAGTSKGMFRSDDEGTSWRQINNGLPPYDGEKNCGYDYVNGVNVIGIRVFAATRSGLYVSINDGASWTRASADLANYNFSYVVERDQLLFAGGLSGLWVSANNGLNWQRAENGLPKFYGDVVQPVNVFTASGTGIYAGLGAGIYRSFNNGLNWTEANSGLRSNSVSDLLSVGDNLFATSIDSGIFRSNNGGKSWIKVNNGLINLDTFSLAVIGTQLFAGGRYGLAYRSSDNGASWIEADNGLPNGRVETLVASGATLYAGVADNQFFEYNESLFGGGIYRSTDSGANWISINSNLPQDPTTMDPTKKYPNVQSIALSGQYLFAGTQGHGIFRSSNNGASWTAINSGVPRNTAGIYPSVDSLLPVGSSLFAGTFSGLFRSIDNGNSWTQVFNQPFINTLTIEGGALFAGTGLFFSNPRLNNGGVFMSIDGGATWAEVKSALTNKIVGSLAFHQGGLYAGTGGNGVVVFANNVQSWTERELPNKFVNAVLTTQTASFVGTLGSGIFRSPDQGQNWQSVSSGLPQNANVQALSAGGINLFAGLLGNGVYRSNNNGGNWVVSGLAQQNINALQTGNNGLIFAATDTGVFRSPTSNDSWTSAGLSNQRVVSLLRVGARLLAGTNGGGIYSSNDDGANWTQVGSSTNGLANPNVSALTVGTDSTSLFAGTDGGGIYRSTNGGQSWTAVNSDIPQNLNVYGFAVSGTKLYAGSVYGIFLSEDNGAHWKQINAGLLDIYVTSLGVSGKTLIAGTRVGGVFTSQIP